MPPSAPDYIFFGGSSIPAPPFTCAEVQFFSLPFAGDPSAIGNFVDRTLNAATTPGRYCTIANSNVVFFGVMAANMVGSATPPYDGYGTMAENDVGFWIPVQDTRNSAICWFAAYLYVDNPAAVIGGREVWGFPKIPANMQITPADPSQAVIIVSTLAVHYFSPSARFATAEIFRLTPGDNAAKTRVTNNERLAIALRRPPPPELSDDWFQLLLMLLESASSPFGAPMIFLKQLRDAASTSATCYQSVITANATTTVLRGQGFLTGDYTLRLEDYANQPIAGDLGLLIGDQTANFGIWVDLDFTMGLAT
jgi:hypothetical protein